MQGVYSKLLFSPSGTVKVLEHWRSSGLRACKIPSSVALKVTPCGQSGHEMARESILKLSCRGVWICLGKGRCVLSWMLQGSDGSTFDISRRFGKG